MTPDTTFRPAHDSKPESASPPAAFTNEDRLCLLLARGPLTAGEQSRACDLLIARLDWQLILDRARAHQVYPLLYRNLRQLGFPSVPDAIQSGLKGLCMANALRNQLLAEELARLLRLLHDASIPVIPLKGVALAQSLFSDSAARVCSDLDLFVPAGQVDRAVNVLTSAGYRDLYGDAFFRKLALRHGRHLELQREHAGQPLLIELHWELVQHSSRNDDAVADLWSEALPATCFGSPALAPSPEWELLYLAVHAAEHAWQSLKWIADIHQLCRRRPPAWPRLKEKAERFELDLVLRQTLAVCSHLLELRLPEEFVAVPPPAGLRLFPLEPLPHGAPEAAFYHLALLRRRWDKLRCAANIVFTPKLADRDFLRLPPALSLLYYPLRAVRLPWKRLLQRSQ